MKVKATLILLAIGLLVTYVEVSAADGCGQKSKHHRAAKIPRSETQEFADDYRARRDQGDTAQAHGYQPCRDAGRCGGNWGYGYGYGGYGYGGYGYGGYYGGASPGWSRSYWRGSDLPTTGYHYYHGR